MRTAGNRFLTLSTKLMLSVVVVVVVALSALLVANGLGRAARDRLIEAKATTVSMLSDLLAESLALAAVLPAVMTHLARNAVAHGIETPAERRSLGKPAGGHLLVSARELGNDLEILFEDDGRGLARDRIRSRAEELGLSGRDEELVFAAGLSTSGETVLSGRGVGLGAVRQDLSPVIYLYTSDPSVSQHLPGFDGGFSRKGDDEALLAQVDAAFRLKRLRDASKARRQLSRAAEGRIFGGRRRGLDRTQPAELRPRQQ